MDTPPNVCQFEHAGFATLGDAVFRLTKGDRVAALALRLESNDVLLPLPALARLFDIHALTKDGQMLRLIEQALRFVPSLKIGDALPPEVVSGKASWQPAAHHVQAAAARLQRLLLNWIGALAGPDEGRVSGRMLAASLDDPAIRPRVQEALRRAATELGAPNGEAVAAMIEALAQELGYLEALRERLLDRVQDTVKRLVRVGQLGHTLSPARRETLVQVTTLATSGSTQIAARFEEIDAQSDDIIAALRNIDGHREFLRPQRDRLYSLLLEWEPVLQAWEALPASLSGEGVWKVIEDTYRFLAPRYMPVQQWQGQPDGPRRLEPPKSVLTW